VRAVRAFRRFSARRSSSDMPPNTPPSRREYRVDFREPVGETEKRHRIVFTFANAEDAADAGQQVLRHHQGAEITKVRPTDDRHNPIDS